MKENKGVKVVKDDTNACGETRKTAYFPLLMLHISKSNNKEKEHKAMNKALKTAWYYRLILLVVTAISMASCSENDNTIDEYADWQKKNETYFNQLYATTKDRIAKGDDNWKIIRQWSLPNNNNTVHDDLSNYIIVHVLEKGNSTSGSPLFTDSVMVNYRGYLIPSPSYPSGFLFDRSYSGAYNIQTMKPVKLAVSGVVDGFASALMHMSIGDRWEVYIPYQLGYGNQQQASGSIPAYSTLIFDIGLAGFTKPKAP